MLKFMKFGADMFLAPRFSPGSFGDFFQHEFSQANAAPRQGLEEAGFRYCLSYLPLSLIASWPLQRP